MELFLPLLGLWSKNFFYNIFSILPKEFKNGFQNRKWNYFSQFWASDQKTSFTTSFPYLPRSSKLIFKTGNEIIQTGNGIISPTSGPLIKKLLLQHIFHTDQRVQHWFSKQEIELSKHEMEFLPLLGLWSKNCRYSIFSILTNEFKISFKNRKWNHFSHF